MRLHIFNPEHDLVLAAQGRDQRYTPPRAAVALRRDLGFMPAFWADEGDAVLVDDVERARTLSTPFARWLHQPLFVGDADVRRRVRDGHADWEVLPWGWNRMVRQRLLDDGLPPSVLPSDDLLGHIRQLSHRATTIPLLHQLVGEGAMCIGERWVAHTREEVLSMLKRHGGGVLKAPWSSTGRGVRFVGDSLSASEQGFVDNTLALQQAIIVEPHYDRVLDFAMEYEIATDGPHYAGLSLFRTDGTGYVGGMIAPEEEKQVQLGQLLPLPLLSAADRCLRAWLRRAMGIYTGPVGVDMMVVCTPQGHALHPCVEVNVRRTMGHAAIGIARRLKGTAATMTIEYNQGNYQLKII